MYGINWSDILILLTTEVLLWNFFSEQIYDLYEKIKSNEIVETNNEYHDIIAKALMDDYDLAFDCFASCSVEFYMWFSKDYLYKLVEIIEFHGKKELLLLLKQHLLELVDDNPLANLINV